MKKAEIIKRLKELEKILKMTPEEYAEYANKRYPDMKHKVTKEEACYFRTGAVQSEISWILEN